MAKLGSTLLLVGGIAAVALVAWRLRAGEAPAKEGGGRPPFVLSVTLAPLERDVMRPVAHLTGVVRSNQHARIGFESAGRIVEMPVDEGQQVETDALLARIDDRDAQAGLARAKAQLQRAERELEQTLSGEREEDKRRLAAELAAREAEAELARRDVERGRGLRTENVISQGEFDALEAGFTAAQARVEAARETLAVAQAGARPEEIAVARAEVELRRSEVDVAERELAKTRLIAPFAGSVVRRSVALGASVLVGQQVFELVDLGRLEIEIDLPPRVAATVELGAIARATLDEHPGATLAVRLDSLVPLADDTTRHFRALARIPKDAESAHLFKPGMFARVELETRSIPDAWIAPADAVRITPQGPVVALARPGGPPGMGGAPTFTAELVPVRVIASNSGRSALTSLAAPFAAGDQVVVIGVDMAFPGATLAPRPQPVAGAQGAEPAVEGAGEKPTQEKQP